MEGLENKADRLVSKGCELILAQIGDVRLADGHPAGGRLIKARKQAEEGRFAAAAAPLHHEKLTFRNRKGDVGQNVRFLVFNGIGFGYVFRFDDVHPKFQSENA